MEDPADRSRLCEEILRALPEWFGLEEPIREYIREVAELPTFAVGRDGFLALKIHTEAAAEIYVMGVRPERHRGGIGTALVEASEHFLAARGIEYLQVKTLGPSEPDETSNTVLVVEVDQQRSSVDPPSPHASPRFPLTSWAGHRPCPTRSMQECIEMGRRTGRTAARATRIPGAEPQPASGTARPRLR